VGGATIDPLDAGLVRSAPGPLAAFNLAGVLAPADVHVAMRLARLGDDQDPDVALAVALAVRAPRHGHVCIDLETASRTIGIEADDRDRGPELAWPPATSWIDRLRASPLVAVGDEGPADRPLRLLGSSLYLDRYWRDELAVAADLAARAALPSFAIDTEVMAPLIASLFPEPGSEEQRLAAAAAGLGHVTVIAGGPGTGKTTAVGRILGLLHAVSPHRPPLVALAAPTGKAAARLGEAVRAESEHLPLASTIRQRVGDTRASTLHRLLGTTWGTGSRFRHDRHHRLPHDVVVVDETSMVSLSMMARLVEAVRPEGRLILVGDPNQLASVEAGAVLGDIVGPAASRPDPGSESGAAAEVPAGSEAAAGAMARRIVVLRRGHRFGGGIAALAEAVRTGDADGALALLESPAGGRADSSRGGPAIRWWEVDPASAPDSALLGLRSTIVERADAVARAARSSDASAALEALGRFRVLCAHRHGDDGVAGWNRRIEHWLGLDDAAGGHRGEWYPGRPLLVTRNDYALRLFNGDTGVIVTRLDSSVEAVIGAESGPVRISPARLSSVETVYAMTVHKSQGSQFDEVAVLLPDANATVLTRELLYTAVTRARRSVLIAGTEDALRAALDRPVARASGLTRRLWPPPTC